MSKLVLLDCGVLGVITNPNAENTDGEECREWGENLRQRGTEVKVPAIADFELRREYIRFEFGKSLAELDRLISIYGYVDITREALIKAAELWATSRRGHGKLEHCDRKLDADMILCGMAWVEFNTGKYDRVSIATNNTRDLELGWKDSHEWRDIKP